MMASWYAPHGSGMNKLISLPSPSTIRSSASEDAVREQLDRILADPRFRRSHRCEALLRYVVEQTLQGCADQLKERTIGVEAFQRDPQYDTSSDPVVRVTAGEVRKRLAQYYGDLSHKDEIRIALPLGSYVPELRGPEEPAHHKGDPPALPSTSAFGAPTAEVVVAPVAALEATRGIRRWRTLGFAIAAMAAAAVLTFGLRSAAAHADASAQFWGKFLRSPGTALVSMGGASPRSGPSASTEASQGQHDERSASLPVSTMIAFPDMQAGNKLYAFIRSAGKEARLQNSAETSLADLRSGPTVLVGAGSNSWTLQLTETWPYRFVSDDKKITRGIVEADSDKKWMAECIPGHGPREDYGIVARVHDKASGQVIVVAAGVYTQATAAAGDLLTQSDLIQQIADGAPKDWQEKNVEVVFAVSVMNGSIGAPRIVAKRFW